MATKVAFASAQIPSDTSTFDVEITGETRTPTGMVVWGSDATTLNSNIADEQFSFGVSDFTTVACVAANEEDNVSITDVNSAYSESVVFANYSPGTGNIRRSLTATAKAGGATFTPVQSGLQFYIVVMFVFGTSCKAFSDNGDADVLQNEPIPITHGLSAAPKFGLFGYNDQNTGTQGIYYHSIGFASMDGSIKQASIAFRRPNSEATTTQPDGRVASTRAAHRLTANALENHGFELTANDSTTTTFTARTGASGASKLAGLLIEASDISADVQIITMPTTAASDWNFNGVTFTPQAAVFATSMIDTTDTGEANDPKAGSWGVGVMDDEGFVGSVNVMNEDGITLGVTNTNSRTSNTEIVLYDHTAGSKQIAFNNPTFTADGWDVAAADISNMVSPGRHWPALIIEAGVEAVDTPILVPTGPLR